MSIPSVKPRQLEQLFQNIEDCQITGAEHAQLMELLRTNSKVRSAYIDHMEFAGLLHASAEVHAEMEGTQVMVEEVPTSRQFLRSVLVAAAVLLLAAVAASLLREPTPPRAMVVMGPNAAWSFTAGGLDPATGFLPGSKIALDFGSLDIQLGSGNQLILEGPARLRIVNPELVDLSTGRLWARAGSGELTVRTGRLKVIDLGTEFGVIASEVLGEEVHVKKGTVMVKPKHSALDSITLVAGEAVRANAIGKIRRVPFSSEGFLTDLPSVVPYQHWTFDDVVEDEFLSSGMGIESASMGVYSLDEKSGISADRVEGRFGDALDLSREAIYAKSGFVGIEGDVARTVALWVRAGPQSVDEKKNFTLVAWGLPTEFGTKWRLTISHAGEGMGTVWGGAWGNSTSPAGTSLLDGEWHHLAYVFTGRHTPEGKPEILHYLDGESLEVSFTETGGLVNTECTAKHARPLTLGCQIISKPARNTFQGSLDELYVFRGALGAEQIRSLYQFNSLDDQSQSAD